MNSRYNSWPDYSEILEDDFRARCNSLYLQPLGSTTPNLGSTGLPSLSFADVMFSLVPFFNKS